MDHQIVAQPITAWQDSVWLALLMPVLGSLICAFFSRALGRAGTVGVACSAIFLAFLASCVAAHEAPQQFATAPFEWVWISVPGFFASFSALTDGLTGVMLLVVTLSLIHI